MTQPISFTSSSPRFSLPVLSVGQSQKEFSVNQAHALLDALLHLVVQGEADDPPASPAEGECWIIGSAPTGSWSGQAGRLAAFEAGTWLFVAPTEGLRAFDATDGQFVRYAEGAWIYSSSISLPNGGATVDNEARAALEEIVSVLIENGLIPQG